MYRDGHIFLYSVRRVGRCILYIGRGRDLRSFFFRLSTMFLVAMENVLKRNCDIWWDFFFSFFFFFFFPQMPLLKRDSLQCPSAVNWQKSDENETLTEGERGNGKLYSAKLCKYTHFTLRSVSKSNILKMDFVYYCTVQDSALNVLWLL